MRTSALALREHTRLAEDEIERRVRERLEWVGLSKVEDMKPASLSGGMRKRVGLARAIAMDPQYVLYDEPTTGLDPIMADVIDRLIRGCRHRIGVTSIVVTHDLQSAFKVGRSRGHAAGRPDRVHGHGRRGAGVPRSRGPSIHGGYE